MAREAQRIRAQLPPRCKLVVLDERGEDLTTVALAQRLAGWQLDAAPVAIVIGGPDGIAPELRTAADQTLRLSSLTLPHALVRVLLAEQLYRAWSINAQHPYHRE
jgi:23S rRNA (pseudouridine1915-N3)-methyltransferase